MMENKPPNLKVCVESGIWIGDDAARRAHHTDEGLVRALQCFCLEQKIRCAVDVGCGMGEYTKALIEAGIYCRGYDGNPQTPILTDNLCEIMDFSLPLDNPPKADLVLCLEVAEHIPKYREFYFVNNLYEMSLDWIVLSWAVPGQKGMGHFNERPYAYVMSLFAKDYEYMEEQTNIMRGASVLPWFRNTLIVLRRKK